MIVSSAINAYVLQRPLTTLLVGLTWCASRIAYARGYARENQGRLPGHLLGQLTLFTMTGFLLNTGLRALLGRA